ncbi:MAG: T9SS type A sorting domain-containing protein, partial [FCB group bacterium]|nr:T9SS type A sorting domain-containing protein [FCB group bacterium]
TTSHLSSEVEIYEVEMTADSTLWIGTADGLYRGGYGGEWWEKVDFISLDAVAAAGSRPTTFELGQNFPNPFNPATTIPVELERSSRIDLQVYDILGRRQKTVLSAILPAGSHDLIWDGSDDQGRDVPSGIYFYRLRTDQRQSTRKMILLR